MKDSRRTNKNRRSRSEADRYWQASVFYNGREYQVLLTNHEVAQGIKRARKNPEDLYTCRCGKRKSCKRILCKILGR